MDNLTFICKTCNITFKKTKEQARRYKYTKTEEHFCSNNCYNEYKKNGKTIICETCGMPKYLPKCRLLDINFCSLSCSNTYKNKNRKKIDLSEFDWHKIQEEHNNGINWTNLSKHIGIPFTTLVRANNEGYIKKIIHKKILTEEHRIKISNALKISHNTGKHPGWSHINTDPKYRSYPEKFFKNVLLLNGILEKYTVIEQLVIGKYFLDFAIIELKLDIEIDGLQHIRNNNNIEHDIIRDSYLIDNGWRVYRILWKDLFNDTSNKIKQILIDIENINIQSNSYYNIDDINLKINKSKYGTRLDYSNAIKNEYKIKQEPYIELILNSNIDFSKHGWVNKVALLINKKQQKINSWMKKYMPDFYEKKCFKRTNSVIG